MKALDQLANLLGERPTPAAEPPSPAHQLDDLIGALRRRVDAGTSPHEPEDQQWDAVQRFWMTEQVDSLRTARLLCFGLVMPRGPGEPCLLEDDRKLAAVLAAADHWQDEPRRFRRCVQGLIRSYFAYDANSAAARPAGRRNWERLRDYLQARLPRIADKSGEPDWVRTALANRHLFGDAPCGPHAEALLRGESAALDSLCERLGIIKSSWFLRALLMAQVALATAFDDGRFQPVLAGLLALLSRNPALRDGGLVLLLERHARSARPPRRQELIDAALAAFGNPWQPRGEVRWGGISAAAREMVAGWLKADLVERFFARLSRDTRRAAFWQRYLKAMSRLQVVLGRDAPQAVDERRALREIGIEIIEAQGSNHALLMTIGPLLLVEFSDRADALFGYETRKPLPFDLAQPLATLAGARNTLKSDARGLWLQHRDGLPNWRCWEDMFAATLKKNHGIEPGSATVADRGPHIDLQDSGLGDFERGLDPPPLPLSGAPMLASSSEDAHWRTAEALSVGYSRSDLAIFARAHGLTVVDEAKPGDGLWVHAAKEDAGVQRVLAHWGFERVPGAGWRR